MLNDAAVLARLESTLKPEEVRQVVSSVRQVPLVWLALHNEGFLDSIMEHPEEITWTAAGITDCSLLYKRPTSSAASDDLDATAQDHDVLDQLVTLALEAHALAKQINESTEIAVNQICERTGSLTPQLTCAWPHIKKPEELLTGLAEHMSSELAYLIVTSLRANHQLEDVVNLLKPITRSFSPHLIDLVNSGNHDLIFELVSNENHHSIEQEELKSAGELAYLQSLRGESDQAQVLLNLAWDASLESTASVADHFAAIARMQDDTAMELEARRKACEQVSTPLRRAALARSLIEHGKHFEAAQLTASPEIIEERIAFGIANLSQNLPQVALESLSQATQEAIALGNKDLEWLDWLEQGLEQSGGISAAIDLLEYQTTLQPSSTALEIKLSKLYELAGDPKLAAQHAHIALTLGPDSTSAIKQVAHSLRVNGQSVQALDYFQKVIESDEDVLSEYCECALEAEQIELALELAEQYSSNQPTSAEAQTLLGRAYYQSGLTNEAKAALERASELDPQNAESLLILAELHEQAGESSLANQTLHKALEIAPENAKVYFARGQWLAQQERLFEASELIAKALQIEPSNVNWLQIQAGYLTQLGDQNGALDHLTKALQSQPRNPQIRLELARTFEMIGQVTCADEVLEGIETDLPSDAHGDVGRILIKVGLQADPIKIEKGLQLLENTDSKGKDRQEDLIFWKARGQEALGELEQAQALYHQYISEGHDEIAHHLQAALGYSRVSIQQGQAEQAIAFLGSIRDQYPASPDILELLVEAYLSVEDYDRASRIAQDALELNPLSIEANQLVSKAAEAAGDLRTAIIAEEEIQAQRSGDLQSLSRLACLHATLKEKQISREYLAKAITGSRKDPERLMQLSEVSEACGFGQTQLRLAKHAARFAPSDRNLQDRLAEIATAHGDFKSAAEAWLRRIVQEPESSELKKHAAKALSKTHDLEEAIRLWEEALSAEPEDSEILQSLGDAYTAIGIPSKGIEYYQALLEIEPQDPDIVISVANIMHQYGDPERAQRMVERTLKANPDHYPAQLTQIATMLRNGEADEALKKSELLIEIFGEDAENLSLAALSAAQAKQVDKASTGLDEALKQTHLPIEVLERLLFVSAALAQWRIFNTLLAAIATIATESELERRRSYAALLRARDIAWMHSLGCSVEKNLPDRDWLAKTLQKNLDAITKRMSDESINTFSRWLMAEQAPITPEEFHTEEFSADQRQSIVQAAALSLLQANRPAQALSMLDASPPSGMFGGYHALLSGYAAMKAEQYARAKDCSRLAANYLETRAMSTYLRAKIAMAESANEEAISALNEALGIWPDEVAWHVELATLYNQQDRFEAALPHLQQAAEHEPNQFDVLLALARTYRANGEWSNAEAIYSRCLQSSPTSAQIWKEAGEVALTNGHAAQAESWFEQACSLAPSDAICIMGSARSALLSGDKKLAVERAQSAYKLSPNEPQVLTGFAEILAKQGKVDKAIQAYDRALKISAGDPQILLARGRVLIQDGQFADALNDIKSALESFPQDPKAIAMLAEAYESSGKLDKALDALKDAIELAPRTSAYRLAQGRLYRKAGQLDQALQVLRELELEDPDYPSLAGEIGQVYEARRETDPALEAYMRAVVLDPGDITSCMQAGLLLKNLKSYEQAAEMFEQVVKEKPNDAKALHQLAAVRALQLVHGGIATQVVAS
jgi:tetratricopeptide (TPR) repeat protein